MKPTSMIALKIGSNLRRFLGLDMEELNYHDSGRDSLGVGHPRTCAIYSNVRKFLLGQPRQVLVSRFLVNVKYRFAFPGAR